MGDLTKKQSYCSSKIQNVVSLQVLPVIVHPFSVDFMPE